MDTKLCNNLNKSYRLFEKLNNSNNIDFNSESYRSAIKDIYKTVYNTEQHYLNSECSQTINDYLKHGNVELEKYETINNESKELQHNERRNDTLNVISLIIIVGLMFLMK